MLPINFSISPVSVTRPLVDVRINLRDRYQHLVYTKKVLPHQIPISYVGFPDPTHRDIEIIDENETASGDIVLENSYRERVPRVFSGRNFILPSKTAMITDVFVETARGGRSPLFYKHEISDGFEAPPEVFDKDNRPVDGEKFRIIISEGTAYVFHNLSPKVDYENLATEVYFVKYTNSLGERKSKLLESYPAYKPANLEEGLSPLLRRYTVRDIGTGFDYRILFNHPGPFFVRITESDQIKAKRPLLLKTNSAWNLSVTCGEVFVAGVGPGERYSLPEYHFQNFAPIEPVRYLGARECLVLNDHIVKTPVNELLLSDAEYLDILVTDNALSPKYAWSTRFETEEFWVDRFNHIEERSSIVRFPFGDLYGQGVSVDRPAGLIYLPVALAGTDRVFVRAFYEAKELQYLELNLNPVHNTLMQTGRAVLYVVPESVSDGTRALFHLVLDEDGEIVDWNDLALGDGALDGAYVGDVNESGWEKFRIARPEVLLVASVAVVRNVSVDDMSFIDVRERGGKLLPSIKKNIIELTKTYPELQWLDFPDRQMSLPLHGAVVFDVPFEVTEDGGGLFTREGVLDVIRQRSAVGQMPIIRYTAPTPEVCFLKFDSGANELTVQWTSVSGAASYRLYFGLVSEYLLSAVDVTGTPDVDGTLSAVITEIDGMDIATFILDRPELFVKVAPIISGTIWPHGETKTLNLAAVSDTGYISLGVIVEATPVGSNDLGIIIGEE